MTPFRFIPFAVALLSTLPSLASTIYVSPAGSDRWTGRLAAPNAARTDGPVATLERARDIARLRRGQADIVVGAGTYRLARTLVFDERDSGAPERPFTVRAARPGAAVQSGARPIRGWRRAGAARGLPSGPGVVFVADLSRQGMSDYRFRELFLGNRRLTLARHPNTDPIRPITGGYLYVDEAASEERTSFHYRAGDLPLARLGAIPQAEVSIFPYNCWDHNISRINEAQADTRLIRLRYPVAGAIRPRNRYFVQNVLGALDSPGEWYCDWSSGLLYLRLASARPPGDGEVTAPDLENLIEISGTTTAPVSHVRLQGFALTGARHDAVVLEGARDCLVVGCRVTRVGGVGINVGYLRNAQKGIGLPRRRAGRTTVPLHSGDRALCFSHPCLGCRVVGNDVEDVGGDGIALHGERNAADNNVLSGTGWYDRVCAAITVCGDDSVVSHNRITSVPRDGVFINGARNTAEFNDIRFAMLSTADDAAITLRQHDVAKAVRARGNVIRYNRIRDTRGYGSYPHCVHPSERYASPFAGFAIYLDGSISGVTVYGNLIARSGAAPVFVQFGGGNVIENNIIVQDGPARPQYDALAFFGTFMFADTQKLYIDKEPPNVFRHNVFTYAAKDAKLYSVGHWTDVPSWDPKQAVFESNLVWHGGAPVEVEMHRTLSCKTFGEWKERGLDRGSIEADPLFVEPARDDYRLQPNSPATAVGYRDISSELARVGPYASPERASWPPPPVGEPEKPMVFAFRREPLTIVDGFELLGAGGRPAGAQVAAEPPTSLAPSERAARTGRRSLEFRDLPGGPRPWEPHVYYSTHYASGKVSLQVDVLNSSEQPADYYMEFRDWRGELHVGPSFRSTADGRVFVNDRMGVGGDEIARIPNGKWARYRIDFAVGSGAAKTYTLTLSVDGRPDIRAERPFPDQSFAEATWFGISSTSAAQSRFYIDNLLIGDPASPKFRGASAAPSVRGSTSPPPIAVDRLLSPGRLAGEWRLSDSDYRLADTSGNQLHGSQGGAMRARGAFGSALYVDEGTGAAVIPDSPLLHFGKEDFSVEFWLMPTRLAIDSEHKRRRILDKGQYPAAWWNVDVWADGRLQMEMIDPAGQNGTTVSQKGVRAGQWTHVVISVSRSSGATTYYLDGELDSRRPLPASFQGSVSMVGTALTTGLWQQFAGLLSDLRIYRRALAESDVRRRYEAGRARHTSTKHTVVQDD